MQISIKEIEQCKLTVSYEADAEEILNKRADILTAFKKAPVPGFRQGKASVDAIKIHYRQQIEEALKRGLAEDAYHNTLFEKKLRPHGAPKFNSLILSDGKFTCEFDMHTKPDFELAPYKDLELPKPNSVANVVDVTEKMLQELRVKFGEVMPYADTDFIQTGDNVIINYDGFLEDQKLDNLCAEGEMLTVGRSSLPAFDDNLLGMVIGDTREFDLTVPETGLPSLAGKKVHIKATLSMGSKTIPAPLDDTLAVKMGKKDFNELRAFVSSTAAMQVEAASKGAVNEAISNRLVNDNLFKIPNWLTLSEAQYLVSSSKLDWDKLEDLDKEKYLELAEKNVKLSLVLDKIREAEPEAQLTDHEVFDVVKQNISRTKMNTSMDDIIKELNRTGYLQILFSRIRDEYVMDFIVKNSKMLE